MGTNVPTQKKYPKISRDGTYGTITLSRLTPMEVGIATAEAPREIKPFHCPNCGGNSYRVMNGKTICEYCDTEFMDAGKSSKPIDITRPAPLPTTITR